MNLRNIVLNISVLLALSLLLATITSCDRKEILESEGTSAPELTDPIPFDLLGSGVIVFERIGPYPGEWGSWYVIDIERKITWSLNFKSNTWLDFISPDGEKIAFSADAIYTMNIDGRDVRKITESGFGYMSSWSSDSKKLYFRQGNPPRLYSRSAIPNASDLKLIKTFTTQTYPGSPDWSIEPSGAVTVSSGGKIAYSCNNNQEKGLAGIYVMENDGSGLTLIVSLPGSKIFDSPVFSPDGEKIYFFSIERDSSGKYQGAELTEVKTDGSSLGTIATLPASGSNEWGYSVLKSSTIFLACSPDGNKLLFNLPEDDFVSHLYAINVNGTGLTQVTSAAGVTDRCVSWGR